MSQRLRQPSSRAVSCRPISSTSYAHAVQDGKLSQTNDILAALPSDSAEAIKRVAVNVLSAAITTSMVVSAVIALVGGC